MGLFVPAPLVVVVVELDDDPQADARIASASVAAAAAADRFLFADFMDGTPQVPRPAVCRLSATVSNFDIIVNYHLDREEIGCR